MAPGANVRSLDAIKHLRPSVIRIEGDLSQALAALRTELNRTLQWIDHDCPEFWQRQVRESFDRVAQARTELMRKEMITVAGHKADCIEEKKSLQRAKQRLELSQEKIKACRQWSVKVHRVADEFSSKIGRTEQSLAHRIPHLLGLLERIILSLEAYTMTNRPSEVPGHAPVQLDAGAAQESAAPADEAPPADGAAATAAATDGAVASDQPSSASPAASGTPA